MSSEPHAVPKLSGIAPSCGQESDVSTGITCVTGSSAYSAYPPSKSRPIPPMAATMV